MFIILPYKSQCRNFLKEVTCLGENTKKYITLHLQWKKKLQELMKMVKKLQNTYLRYYNLLIVQSLWQVHYQILSIIFLKEFFKSNVNMDTIIKNVKHSELNTKLATVFLNTKALKMFLQNTNVNIVTKMINKSLMKSLKSIQTI